jgi:hypothetical protein
LVSGCRSSATLLFLSTSLIARQGLINDDIIRMSTLRVSLKEEKAADPVDSDKNVVDWLALPAGESLPVE